MDNISFVKKVTNSQDPCFAFKDPLQWSDSVVVDFERKTGYKMNEAQKKVLQSSLNYRMVKSYDKNFQGQIFNKINGIYEVLFTNGKQYFLQFSNEPAHILARTTGRTGYSCEHIDNGAWLGPFHDIALMNSTIYFSNSGGYWLGRLNIRWGVTPEGKVVVGVDPNIYPMSAAYADRPNTLLKEAVYYILKDYLDYDVAKTPYLYKGHSDTTAQWPNVSLPFKGYKSLMASIKPRIKPSKIHQEVWNDIEWERRFDFNAEVF
tara:strand:+ start:2540 stop:3325 length:786 start_codon:yes stop_codon:yes gene_type:complete